MFHLSKMLRTDGNAIRPRKSSLWSSESTKHKHAPIFKIDEIPNSLHHYKPGSKNHYNHYSNTTPLKEENSINKPEIRKTVVNQIAKYCENTTLHGLRYVGDSSLTFGERLFWLISFTLAIGFAAYYISIIYAKWRSSPVIISFSPFDAEVSSIPFPAITICNMNQAKRYEAEKILRDGSNIEKKLLDDSCNGNATFNNTENISWESLRDFLVGNSCSDMLRSCQWGAEKIDCDVAFNNDLTDEGLCCSFNRLPPERIFRNLKDISILNQTYPSNVYDWNAEKGYGDRDIDDSIPRRPLGAGAHLGLSLILDAQIDNYYCSSTRSTGFKVMLANPIETPKMADFGFLISPGFETRITIEPSIREATSTLRQIPISKRQCYFANERPLQYYRTYTLQHCNNECVALLSLKYCNCVPLSAPGNANHSVQFCDPHDKCLESLIGSKNKENTAMNYLGASKCNCLPSCISIDYDIPRLNTAPLFHPGSVKSGKSYFRNNVAEVNFFFEQLSFTRIEKLPVFTFTDLVAYTGGLLGFFTGFSFLSAVEFFFHIIWLTYKRHVAKMKKTTTSESDEPDHPYMD